MSPPFSFEIKGEHQSKVVFVSCLQQGYTLRDRYKTSANGHEQWRRQVRVYEALFLSLVLQIHFPHRYQKCSSNRCYRGQDQSYRLPAELQHFAFCEKH